LPRQVVSLPVSLAQRRISVSPYLVASLPVISVQRRISVSDLMQTYSTILNLHHTKNAGGRDVF